MGKKQSYKQVIQSYLEERAKSDSLFAVSYAKPNKKIDECCNYIIGEARKRGGDVVCMTNEEVFGLAVHYYDEDNIKVEKQSNYEVAAVDKPTFKQPLPKEETPTYTKHKGKKKNVSSAQFLLFDEL